MITSAELNGFVDNLLNDVSDRYNNDEFEDGFAGALEEIKTAICKFFEEKEPDLKCEIAEYDPALDEIFDLVGDICEIAKYNQVREYFTTSWNGVYLCVILTEKGDKQ